MATATVAHAPRRPVFFDAGQLEAHGGWIDPTEQVEAAHETAAVLVHTGRAAQDPQLTARLVDLVEDLGLSTVADLWAARPARSLPGSLWRLYALREWVLRDPVEASREYAAGARRTAVDHAVAGAAEPPGPDELRVLVDAVLRGVFEGDLAVALERAAAFCRVAVRRPGRALRGGADGIPGRSPGGHGAGSRGRGGPLAPGRAALKGAYPATAGYGGSAASGRGSPGSH